MVPILFFLNPYLISSDVNSTATMAAGWSHHFVSRRRYHLIIPSDDDWDRTSLRPDAFEQQTHILHGLVHCNGFGHLLRLNGRDGGSHFVAGRDVMDLWDRLCTALRVRYESPFCT